ncbi:GrpB family protein [Rossellomorea sp. LJF3]|uniref:GrpB family protein n=1 Tax=Rossellomorea sp. LJF3 TaxID=3126099 RepID=UPI00300C7607
MENSHWPKWAVESIEVVPPKPEWIEAGKAEVRGLLQRLSSFGVKEVEHVGSTSIRDLPAKPIIDVMALIPSFDEVEEVAGKLAEDDWNFVPVELDNRPWRRFFIKVEHDKRVAHLHLMLKGEPRWEQQRLFRDRLNGDPSLKEEYAELKKSLANQFPDDREAYSEGKANFIERVLDGSEMGEEK